MKLSEMQANEYINNFRHKLHPAKDFIIVSQFNVPLTQNDAHDRIKINLVYFKNNYLAICFSFALLFLFTSIISIACLALLGLAIYAYLTNPHDLLGKFTNKQMLIALTVYGVLVSVFTDTFPLIAFGTLSGVVVSFAHAVFFEKSVDFV